MRILELKTEKPRRLALFVADTKEQKLEAAREIITRSANSLPDNVRYESASIIRTDKVWDYLWDLAKQGYINIENHFAVDCSTDTVYEDGSVLVKEN